MIKFTINDAISFATYFCQMPTEHYDMHKRLVYLFEAKRYKKAMKQLIHHDDAAVRIFMTYMCAHAVARNSIKILIKAVKYGGDATYINYQSRNFLHFAGERLQNKMVRKLLQLGADKTLLDDCNLLPLQYVIKVNLTERNLNRVIKEKVPANSYYVINKQALPMRELLQLDSSQKIKVFFNRLYRKWFDKRFVKN